jgi:hypothetical protein
VTRIAVFALGLSLLGADVVRAQIIDSQRGTGQPLAFASLSAAWTGFGGGLCNEEHQACWDMGSGLQWRGSLEMPMGRGASIGVAGTLARLPITYQNIDADVNLTQVMANLHIGGGSGFYQVIDASAGISMFSNFRSTAGAPLGPGKTTSDFHFNVGYGFAYAWSPRFEISLMQEYGLIIGDRIAGSTNNTTSQQTTRVGVRVGLGEKQRRY